MAVLLPEFAACRGLFDALRAPENRRTLEMTYQQQHARLCSAIRNTAVALPEIAGVLAAMRNWPTL